MKRFLMRAMVVFGLMVFAVPAWSLTITDVVQVDSFIAGTDLGPGANPTVEEAWAEGVLGIDLTFMFKFDGAEQSWEQLTDSSSIFAQAVNSPYPLYFLFKTGAPNSNDYRQFLFQNINALSYLVVDLAALGFTNTPFDVDVFSHVEGYNGAPIPEPGTMMLLGSGLVGLAGWGRKKFRR